MSDKYYVAGCVDNGLSAEVVEDEHAEFWTLYERDSEGLSEAIIDCVSRKEAETAMAVYVERDRLTEQVQALRDDRAEQERIAISNFQECAKMDEKVRALAAEGARLKAAIETHKHGFVRCNCCGDELMCHTDDVCRALDETPATDAILREVRARAVEGLKKHPAIGLLALGSELDKRASAIRAGEVTDV